VELGVLEMVLWVVGAVHHPTGAAGRRSKLLLTRVLCAERDAVNTQRKTKVQQRKGNRPIVVKHRTASASVRQHL